MKSEILYTTIHNPAWSEDMSGFLSQTIQKVKTSVIKKTVNPVWDEDLTLAVKSAAAPIKLVSICIPVPLQ